MTEMTINPPKLDPAVRDKRISCKARNARRLEKIAKHGTHQDKQAARNAQLERDTYIDVFSAEP